MANRLLNDKDANRVLGGVNDPYRVQYEQIRRKMKLKMKLEDWERRYVEDVCADGRSTREEAAEEGFNRLFDGT